MPVKEFIKDFPVVDLVPFPRNPRINKKAIDEVIKSIERTGNNDPIEINESNVILCGHTRRLALIKMDIKNTDVIKISGLTGEQENEYRIRNNKAGELAEWDFDILDADFTQEQLSEFGFKDRGLNDPYEEWTDMPEYQNEKVGYRSIVVHIKDKIALDKFVDLLQCNLTEKTKYIHFPEKIQDKTKHLGYKSSNET
jgi:hypothetical protein